jgi:8-oxo-dGTP pyrophosphatase MutT (NUDIX family)
LELEDILEKLQKREPTILDYEKFKKSAILIPLLEKENELHLLFEVRSFKMRTQPGDICFPGGRVEQQDKSPLHTAIRETTEELGIDEKGIKNVIPLDYLVSDMGRVIYPFIGKLTNPEEIIPHEAEVEEVFTVPLYYFLETKPERHTVNVHIQPDESFPFELIVGGENYNWQIRQFEELFYQYDGKAIWGLTAKILTHFVDLIKQEP